MQSNKILAGIRKDVWDFPELVLLNRFAQALEEGKARYPFHRTLRFAARTELESLFDALALNLGWTAHRLDSRSMILDSEGQFISVEAGRKSDYCSCLFGIWAKSKEVTDNVIAAIFAQVGAARITEPMFSIDWYFMTARGDLRNASIEELADDVLHDEAYPELEAGVSSFIARYLDAPETVLVLQGPSGTGKTRLIRAILGEISRRKGGEAQAMYTGDKKALESDEIFVAFITGSEDAFVVEDADHLLKPRAEGNENLHRFLAIADGVVRAQGRKVIFSTNLPNVGDLDDALLRPGRCFARLYVRELNLVEAKKLLMAITKEPFAADRAVACLHASERNNYSLADIYSALARS